MILLKLIVILTAFLFFLMLISGFFLGSSSTYAPPQKAKKLPEKKEVIEEGKIVNPNVVEALRSLGFKRQESIKAARVAAEKLGDAETEVLVKEALGHL